MLVLFCWDAIESLMLMLLTMVELILTLMHKGKKITLVPMTPSEIVKYEQDKAKQKGVVGSEAHQPIKLKQPSFLVTKMDLAEIADVPDACYALV
jgi:hypothetical protein